MSDLKINTFEDFMASGLENRKLSDEQMAVVMSDKATLVSAGAGSGKTTVLSYRFLRLLLEGKAKVDEILTLTFTNKAASEMYGRIFNLVERVSHYNSMLAEQMKDFARANISTLDSFAAEVARTDSMRWGITRDFSVLDKDETERMIRTVTEDVFETMKDDVMLLMKDFRPSELSDGLFSYLARSINVLSAFDAEESAKAYEAFMLLFRSRYERLMLEFLARVERDIPSYPECPFFEEGGKYTIAKLRDMIHEGRFSDLPRFDLRYYGFGKKFWRPLKPELRKFNDDWRLMLQDLSTFDSVTVAASMRIFSYFTQRLAEEKRRKGLLAFSDVEALSLRILKTNTSVRNYYKKKFRWIMIDEFQDNSIKQKELLYILSEKEELTDTTGVPKPEDLDDKKLFFVGDDKQSIYYFRGADVSVFNNLKDEIEKIGGVHLTMGTNWRSEPALIDAFNRMFPIIMEQTPWDEDAGEGEGFLKSYTGRDTSRYEAEYEKIGSRNATPGIKPNIVYLKRTKESYPAKDYDGEELLSGRENEAEFIADLVREMTTTDKWLVPGGKDEPPRRANYEDICILYRSTGIQLSLEKVFRGEDIPYTAVSSTSVGLEALSYDFSSFLRLLVYPRDKHSYLAVLRSPFVRLSDRTIFQMKDEFRGEKDENENGNEFDLVHPAFTYLPETALLEDRIKFENAKALYEELSAMAGRVPVTELVDKLYYEGGYRAYLEDDIDLIGYEEHYEYLWEEANGASDLFDFLNAIGKRLGSMEQLDTDLLRLEEKGVKMMTIHKSKGLEFPIVILADSFARPNNRLDSPLVVDPNGGFIGIDKSPMHSLRSALHKSVTRREHAEMKRLLYVALTRAETHFAVVASPGKRNSGDSIGSMFENAITQVDIGEDWRDFECLSVNEAKKRRKGSHDGTNSGFYEKKVIERPSYKLVRMSTKEYGHEMENYDPSINGPRLPKFENDADEIIRRMKDGKPVFGTLCHETLEHRLKGLPDPALRNTTLDETERVLLEKEARRVATAFTDSGYYEKYVAGHKVYPEQGFYFPHDGMVLEGSVDLLVEYDDHYLVIDYKTDERKDPEIHKNQLTLYATAIEEVFNKPAYGQVVYLRDMSTGPVWDRDGNIAQKE